MVDKVKLQNWIIYCATSPSGKKYIGQTKMNLEKRKLQHKFLSSKNSTSAFHCAIRKYGYDHFIWVILENCSSQEEANNRETYWILNLNTKPESEGGFGYNHVIEYPTRHFSEETRKKMSLAKKGKSFLTKEHYRIIADKNRGKRRQHSDETKIKISKINTGRKQSREQKIAIAKSLGAKSFYVIDSKTMKIIGEYDLVSECAEQLNLNRYHIRSILKGKTKLKTHKGYIFKEKE